MQRIRRCHKGYRERIPSILPEPLRHSLFRFQLLHHAAFHNRLLSTGNAFQYLHARQKELVIGCVEKLGGGLPVRCDKNRLLGLLKIIKDLRCLALKGSGKLGLHGNGPG